MRLPVYFPGVRTYGLSVAFLTALLTVFLTRADSAGVAMEARVLLEIVVPLPLLLVSAGLLQADPALGLLAAKPVRLGGLLLARWALAIALLLPAPLAVHLLVALREPGSGVQALTWLAPTLFLSSIAFTFAALGAGRGIGTGAAIAYWAVSLFLTPLLRAGCAAVPGGVCPSALWSTAHGLLAADGAGWTANRVLLLGISPLLALMTARAYRQPERQVSALRLQEAAT